MKENKLNLEKIQVELINKYEILKIVKKLNLKTILHKSGLKKKQGVEGFSILISMLFLSFLGKSIHQFLKYGRASIFKICSKDTFYRFSKRKDINWRKFLLEMSKKVILELSRYSSWSSRMLIIDDTVIMKRGKNIEELSWVYDHSEGKTVKGFKAVVLGFSDRTSFIPIDFALNKGKEIKGTESKFLESGDKRTISAKRILEMRKSKFELAEELLRRAKQKELEAGAVLFDSWYCMPVFVNKVYEEIGYNVISRLKITPKLMVKYKDKNYSTKSLFEKIFPKVSKVVVKIGKEEIEVSSINCYFGKTEVKLICCKPLKKSKEKNPIILLSTDTSKTELEIIESYLQRWSIEVLFKDAKEKLFFGKYQTRSIESTICFLTLSLLRYILLSYMERVKGDYREKGSIFQCLSYEIEELNILAYIDLFIKQLLSLLGDKMSMFAFFIDRLSEIQSIITTSIQNMFFLRCET